MNARFVLRDILISDHGPMQNETPEEAGKDLRTVRVAPFWEQNQPLLLIAAPEPDAAEVLVAACRGLGIKTLVASSGAAALIAYGRFAPDAVVIGDGLSDLPGEIVAAAISDDTAADTNGVGHPHGVLHVRSTASEGPAPEGLVSKYEDVLSSPVFTELAGRTNSPWPADEELAYGSLLMRPAAFEVTDGGRAVALTLREFELLRVLLLSQGQAVPLGRLKSEVWGAVEEEVRTDTVKVHMNRLRRKLNGPTKPVAVRGIGYVLKNT